MRNNALGLCLNSALLQNGSDEMATEKKLIFQFLSLSAAFLVLYSSSFLLVVGSQFVLLVLIEYFITFSYDLMDSCMVRFIYVYFVFVFETIQIDKLSLINYFRWTKETLKRAAQREKINRKKRKKNWTKWKHIYMRGSVPLCFCFRFIYYV